MVRTTRVLHDPNNDFWWDCKRLFGIDPRHIYELAHINHTLRFYGSIPIPMVLRKGSDGNRPYVVVERLEGQMCRSFQGQPRSILQNLGDGLASIHTYKAPHFGNASGSHRVSASHHTLPIKIIDELVDRFLFPTPFPHISETISSDSDPDSV